MSDRPIVILGAGLSGLSLAHALCEGGWPHPVVLIDRRSGWDRDRTWCTWLTGPLRFEDCITHRWGAWRIQAGARGTTSASRRCPYVHIDAGRVYEAALERISRAPAVEIRLGEGVRSVDVAGDGGPRVHTTAGTLDARLVFDALGPHSPLEPRSATRAVTAFAQRFTGWEVEADTPVFDPGVATLMDFRPHAGTGATFMYVLPFSTTRALLEHTSIEPFDAPRVDRETALAHELSVGYGLTGWRVLRRERGLIPMTAFAFAARRGAGVHTLGAAAGAIRPSSGYAFSRIQRQAGAVAAAIIAGRPLPTRVASPHSDLLDRVFLRALARSRRPQDLFLATAGVDADVFARFMTDAGSPRDEARIIAALPVGEMTRAALGVTARRRIPGQRLAGRGG